MVDKHNPKHLRRTGLRSNCRLLSPNRCSRQWTSVWATRYSSKHRCFFCHRLTALHDRNPPWLGPLHLTGETERGVVSATAPLSVCEEYKWLRGVKMTNISHCSAHDIWPQTLKPAHKNTPSCIALAFSPIVCLLPPFNAKLTQLTVGYSPFNPPPEMDQYSPELAPEPGRYCSP